MQSTSTVAAIRHVFGAGAGPRIVWRARPRSPARPEKLETCCTDHARWLASRGMEGRAGGKPWSAAPRSFNPPYFLYVATGAGGCSAPGGTSRGFPSDALLHENSWEHDSNYMASGGSRLA